MGCIPGELVTPTEEGIELQLVRATAVSFTPNLLFLLFPMEPEAGKKR